MKELTNYLLKSKEISKDLDDIIRNEDKNFCDITNEINKEVKK
jgi:hypothetical protein